MKISLVILVLALICGLAVAQQREQKLVIDPFSAVSNVFFITENPFQPQSGSASTSDNTIIGGERDVIVEATSGGNSLFQAQVGDGEWVVSTPNNAEGVASLQYDGADNSPNLDPTGLNSADLTINLADAFTTVATSDLPTVLTVTVYDDNQVCEFSRDIAGGVVEQAFEFAYEDFSNNCDFQAIGAIELTLDMFENVDVDITAFTLTGDVAPSPSPPPAVPSASSTPAPSSAPSAAPSTVPEPIDDDDCECYCPEFFCGLVYAVPGDDDEGNDDEWYDDDNDDLEYRKINIKGESAIDDDFAGVHPDDDNDNISLQGGITILHNDDDDEEHDGATKYFVTVFVSVASALFVLFF